MPGYKTHLRMAWFAGGVFLLSAAAYAAYHPWHFYILGFFGITLGTLFPDIDITSMGQKSFFTLAAALITISILCKAPTIGAIIGLVMCIPVLTKHRGPFHNPLIISALCALVLYMVMRSGNSYKSEAIIMLTTFWIGALIHITLDKHGRRFKR